MPPEASGCPPRRSSRRHAVAHSLLRIAYHLLRDGGTYEDLGVNYFDERDRQGVQRRLVHRLEALGYTVHLESAA